MLIPEGPIEITIFLKFHIKPLLGRRENEKREIKT
jgi:hypothetical protein